MVMSEDEKLKELQDLSQRFWSESDLAADDWWTQPIADVEALIDEDKELMKILQEMEKLNE
jgi:hypothetical protein